MIDFGTVGARICVVGRTSFGTAAGAVAYGTAELLARNFPVAFRPIEHGPGEAVELPNGRRLPILQGVPLASVFCDAVADDRAWSALPANGLVHAWLPSDPGALDATVVARLNARADVVLAPSERVAVAARRSGIARPVTVLPIPLDLDVLLAGPAADAAEAFISAQPGDGLGAREALAAGRVVVARGSPGMRDLEQIPGVFLVEPDADWAAAVAAAQRFDPRPTVAARRAAAREWSFSTLASRVGALIDPAIARYRAPQPLAAEVEAAIERRLGGAATLRAAFAGWSVRQYDAGFFSIFNAFMSHLVWEEREDRCHAVMPDWDIDRLIARLEREAIPVRSFCYGQPGDGNLWLKLFQPLFGATEQEMQSETFLWRHAEAPFDRHNEAREPHLTYSRAYALYRSPEFEAVRRQYHRVFARHVHLRPELAAEIEAFAAAHLAAPIRIAAHVRHPSHTVEQPSGRIARTDAYVARVREEVRRRGGDPDGEGWRVFVATDQARVLDQFRDAFGDRAVFYPDARRTRADEDAAFEALSPVEQNRDGHQLQHLVAADRSGWNWRMAWEVTRDSWTMARCQALLHVVSNVSTAVSYINPELEMIFCDA